MFSTSASAWVKLAIVTGLVFGLVACSDDDDPGVVGPDFPADALVSIPVGTAPAANATVDALWAAAPALDVSTEVAAYGFPDIWWDNYEGLTYDVTIKSVYTDSDIYFLYQWNDAADSKLRQAWYYNDTASEWMQMPKKVPDAFGHDPAYEDKFTVFWNISMPNFETEGCMTLCHGEFMGTNAAGERADIWHWKRDRTGPVSQVDDKYLNDDANGRHADDGTGAYSANIHEITRTFDGATVSIPMYWIPGRTDYHWVMQTEIDDNTARMIVDQNANGDLVDEDGAVLALSDFLHASDRVIPSLMGIKPATGSRGDVSAWHDHSNGLWTLKIKRARATSTPEQDVQFTSVNTDYWFSIGVMDGAAIAHATPGGFSGDALRMFLYQE